MKYIPADKLIAEIEFAKSVYDNPKRVIHGVADAFRQDGRAAMCDDILKKIASLQQEQLEVDLDFQVFAKEMDAVFNIPKEVTENTEENPLINWEYAIARHFYGLRNRALEEAARHVYESWMGGTMDDVCRDIVGLGRVINARKEE